MQNLWAPWRMEYVSNVDDPGECFLCAAVRTPESDRERLVVYRADTCLCVLNRFPYSNGHVLIAPNEHKGRLDELTDQETLELQHCVLRIIRALEETMGPHGFNVGLNLGRSAGAGLPGHLHWHVVPRWSGDTNFMTVMGDVKVIPQALDRTWEMLHHHFEGE